MDRGVDEWSHAVFEDRIDAKQSFFDRVDVTRHVIKIGMERMPVIQVVEFQADAIRELKLGVMNQFWIKT